MVFDSPIVLFLIIAFMLQIIVSFIFVFFKEKWSLKTLSNIILIIAAFLQIFFDSALTVILLLSAMTFYITMLLISKKKYVN